MECAEEGRRGRKVLFAVFRHLALIWGPRAPSELVRDQVVLGIMEGQSEGEGEGGRRLLSRGLIGC